MVRMRILGNEATHWGKEDELTTMARPVLPLEWTKVQR
jgi:hypothetical protein